QTLGGAWVAVSQPNDPPPLQPPPYHPFRAVPPPPADAHHLDHGEVVLRRLHPRLLRPGALPSPSTWGSCRRSPHVPAPPVCLLEAECYVNLTHKARKLHQVAPPVNTVFEE